MLIGEEVGGTCEVSVDFVEADFVVVVEDDIGEFVVVDVEVDVELDGVALDRIWGYLLKLVN